MPFKTLDLLLFAWEKKLDMGEVGRVMELTEDQIRRAFRDFASKHRATEHLRQFPPSLS
jgi:NAD+ synthase